MLIVGQHVCDEANDKRQLAPTVADVSPVAGPVDNALADTGYFSEAAVLAVESGASGSTAFVAMNRQSHGRRPRHALRSPRRLGTGNPRRC